MLRRPRLTQGCSAERKEGRKEYLRNFVLTYNFDFFPHIPVGWETVAGKKSSVAGHANKQAG